MRITHFLLAASCFMASGAAAQQDNNWYFGQQAALNFSTGKPAAITTSAMNTMEGSASISNEDGQLLFYTNGINVWNKNNQLMPNGTGLFGHQSTTQSAIIVPKPGQEDHYYIFTADEAGGIHGLNYSEVDMAADSGKGDVISLNNPLVTPVCEKITAVYHANGTDIWVTTHHWGSNAFYSYKITSAGVTATPVISNTGLVIEGANNSGRYAGWMSLSPNGEKLATANGLLAAELFDFNVLTGTVASPISIKSPAKCYGVEFSPNSNLLYLASNDKIFQYNIDAGNIQATETMIAAVDVASSLKLGPDSKIYVISKYLVNSMSVINNPDVIGTGCNFALNAVSLADKKAFVGLPNFLTTSFYVLDIEADYDCTDETAVLFSTIGTQPSQSVQWDFGDGTTSNDLNALHTYAATGTYQVNAKAKSGISTRYFTKEVTVLNAPVAVQPGDMIACGEDNGPGVFDLSGQNAEILGSQPAEHYNVSYYASEADAEAGTYALSGTYASTANLQVLYARVMRNSGDCYAITSFTLTTLPKPVISMPDSYTFCKGQGVTVTAPQGFDSYTWSGGEKTRVVQFNKAGTYTLTVTKDNGPITCTATKTITVHESATPIISEININDRDADNTTISITMAADGDYEYSINGTSFQDSSLFTDVEAGQYTVIVKEKNGCGQAGEDILVLMYPKFFTPNGDGENETWKIKFAYFEPGMQVNIFDRYGKHITSFKGNGTGWDGSLNGQNLPSDDYWYTVKRESGREYKGHFAILR